MRSLKRFERYRTRYPRGARRPDPYLTQSSNGCVHARCDVDLTLYCRAMASGWASVLRFPPPPRAAAATQGRFPAQTEIASHA